MNDLGYGQLSNPNRSLKLVLMRVEIIGNFFSDILTRRNREVVDFTRSPVKNNTEFINLGN